MGCQKNAPSSASDFKTACAKRSKRLRACQYPSSQKIVGFLHRKPVQADRGINANFAAESVSTVSDAVRLSTSGLTGQLKDTGQIPRSALGQPIITGVVMGSFGFEMELPTPANDPDGFSYPEEAINLIQNLLKSVGEGSDTSCPTWPHNSTRGPSIKLRIC